MKICSKCQKEKPEDDFAWQRGKRRARCKLCETKAGRRRYWNNPQAERERMKVNLNASRDRNRRYLWDYYKVNPCVDCGETDPVVLELDHVRGEKIGGLSQLVHHARALEVIKAEIAKCDVVCANCHRRRTADSQGWHFGLVA